MLECFCDVENGSKVITECFIFEASEMCFKQSFNGYEALLLKGEVSSIYREVEGVIRLKL